MSPSQPNSPSRSPQRGRRGLAAIGSLAGAAGAVFLFSLSPSTALSGTTLAAASSPVSSDVTAVTGTSPVSAPAAAPQLKAPAYSAVTAPRSAALVPAAAAPAKSQTQVKSTGAQASAPMSSDSCSGVQAAADAFLMHLNAAHLEASPAQQVADLMNPDQYVKTHTVLIENMIDPLVSGSDDALNVFLMHVYAAHLEASPSQQAADLLAVDQYVKTHTVLIENMLAPLVGTDTSSC